MKTLSKKQILKRIAKGKNFSQCYLKYSQFREIDLYNANFFKADLEGADFEGADLLRTNFLAANLEGANLIDANLAEAYLEDANLYSADLEDCDLRKADLRGANLRDANLKKAMLEKADLEKIQAAGANLIQSNCSFADMRGSNLAAARCKEASFFHANLTGSILKGADFQNCDFRYADLSKADLENADLRGAFLEGVKLDGAILDGCKLSNSFLGDGSFKELSAHWLDYSVNGDGSEKVEFSDNEISSYLAVDLVLMVDIIGVMSSTNLISLSRFISVMEKILPQLKISVRKIHSDLGRTRIQLSLNTSPLPSAYSFCFFMIYQFSNSKKIDCTVLENQLIENKSPILSGVLLKKRPLSTEIVKQILKVKKVLKADSPFFHGRLHNFIFHIEGGKKLLLTKEPSLKNSKYSYSLVIKKKDIFSDE